MINQITALESCWHISPGWGKTMPPLAVEMLEKVLLPIQTCQVIAVVLSGQDKNGFMQLFARMKLST